MQGGGAYAMPSASVFGGGGGGLQQQMMQMQHPSQQQQQQGMMLPQYNQQPYPQQQQQPQQQREMKMQDIIQYQQMAQQGWQLHPQQQPKVTTPEFVFNLPQKEEVTKPFMIYYNGAHEKTCQVTNNILSLWNASENARKLVDLYNINVPNFQLRRWMVQFPIMIVKGTSPIERYPGEYALIKLKQIVELTPLNDFYEKKLQDSIPVALKTFMEQNRQVLLQQQQNAQVFSGGGGGGKLFGIEGGALPDNSYKYTNTNTKSYQAELDFYNQMRKQQDTMHKNWFEEHNQAGGGGGNNNNNMAASAAAGGGGYVGYVGSMGSSDVWNVQQAAPVQQQQQQQQQQYFEQFSQFASLPQTLQPQQ